MLFSPAEPSESQLPFDEDDANTLIIPVVPLEDDDLPDQDDIPTTSGSTYEILQEYTFPSKSCLCDGCVRLIMLIEDSCLCVLEFWVL